ncbi:sulfurtransferase TusA family protein [Vibrio gangliei]|uniref:sulfurtransferase TusA family protein n=1 Tax=Vibrio gangliei TaxID=2077090 RepID=UPI000D013A41|nr:sulfurtransferase TusA family protein [Vibrio gangliei]
MSVDSLDLRSERCPMALLRAKRECVQLLLNQSLTILVRDKASLNDMVRFFSQPPYSAGVHHHGDEWALVVTKRNNVECLK